LEETRGKLIGQGYTAEIYQWGEHKILKLYRKNLPNSLCRLEYTITQKIYNQLGICPKVYKMVKVKERNGIIFEKISGKTMLEDMLRNIFALKKQSKLFAHYHLSIQKEVEFELPTVKEKLKNDIQRVPVLTIYEKRFLYQYIVGLPDGKTLCHFDFHPGNIMTKEQKPIMIDWMTACVGDPLSDVARTMVLLKYNKIPSKYIILKKVFEHIKRKIYLEYIKEYKYLTKENQKRIDIWELPVAAARLSECISEDEKRRLLEIVHLQMNIASFSKEGFPVNY